jgi:DNA-directed RNA polymerase subunit RPC12/RpoP
MSAMQVTTRCPGCRSALPVTAAEAPSAIRCGRCGREIPLSFTATIRADERVDRCPVCEGGDFYVRKDFDPKTGLAFVIAGAAISAIFYWFNQDLIAYSVLAAAALIDLVIYGRLKTITVCYRCHAEFRGKYQRTAGAFDLHTADLLEPEWERKIGRR